MTDTYELLTYLDFTGEVVNGRAEMEARTIWILNPRIRSAGGLEWLGADVVNDYAEPSPAPHGTRLVVATELITERKSARLRLEATG